jgi:hypothetical protein
MRDHDENFGLEVAAQWGVEYVAALPQGGGLEDWAAEDSSALAESGGLEALAVNRASQFAHLRLSVERVEEVCGPMVAEGCNASGLSQMEWDRFVVDVNILKVFGESGVPVLTADNFEPVSSGGQFAKSYRDAPMAVYAHIHLLRAAGLGVIFTAEAAALIGGRNEMSAGIALKKGTECGRVTLNASSNSARTGTYLNDDPATNKAELTWGSIKNPTIIDICLMILALELLYGRGNIVLWKTDLNGAYTLLRFDPAYVQLMTTRLMGGLVFVYLYGNFGWSGMCFAFQVVTRVLLACVR